LSVSIQAASRDIPSFPNAERLKPYRAIMPENNPSRKRGEAATAYHFFTDTLQDPEGFHVSFVICRTDRFKNDYSKNHASPT
jgi:hypothetical protein